MARYTKVTNVGFVDCPGPGRPRLWAHIILIDSPKTTTGRFLDDVRQIRGLGNGGVPVFTFWIAPECEVTIEGHAGGQTVMLSHSGDLKPLDSGVVIRAGDLAIVVGKENIDEPVQVVETDEVPWGNSADRDILRYYQAPGYTTARTVDAKSLRDSLG